MTVVPLDTIDISWSIPEVPPHCLVSTIYFIMYILQVLEQGAYNHTLLTVQNSSGDQVLYQRQATSPLRADDLTPATDYIVTLTFVFVGGAEGTPVSVNVSTPEGGKYTPVLSRLSNKAALLFQLLRMPLLKSLALLSAPPPSECSGQLLSSLMESSLATLCITVLHSLTSCSM